MKTIILPGFSNKNKLWADEVASKIENAIAIEWNHWNSENIKSPNWPAEIKKVVSEIGNERVNILAKSIGTFVAMSILKDKGSLINKIILCGIPLNDLDNVSRTKYYTLGSQISQNIICIQNENDNHGTFLQIEDFIKKINPQIKIISKPRSDHEYFYMEDFKAILQSH